MKYTHKKTHSAIKFVKSPFLWVMIDILLCTGISMAGWSSYTTANGLGDDDINCIFADTDDNIWAGTSNGGISMYNGFSWTVYDKAGSTIPSNTVFDIKADTAGVIWIATEEGIAATSDGISFSSYTKASTADGLPGNEVTSIAISSSNIKLFGTRDSGASLYDGVSWSSWTHASTEEELISDSIAALEIDSKYYWFGTYDEGVSRYEIKKASWTTFTRTNTGFQLSSNFIQSIVTFDTQETWICTKGFGISIIDASGNWKTYNKDNSGLADDNVTSVARDDTTGTFWIGTISGLNKFDGTTWSTFNAENSGLLSNYINDVTLDSRKHVWIATEEGIAVLVENKVRVADNGVKIQGGVNGYVNPSENETATIFFHAEGPGKASIKIFNVNGFLIWESVKTTTGSQDSFTWDCLNLSESTVSSGIYLVHIEAPGINTIKKVAVIK